MYSKIGYLLSGPLSPQQTSTLNVFDVTTQYIDTEGGNLKKFWAIELTGTSSVTVSDSNKTFLQSYNNSSNIRQPNGSDTLLDSHGRWVIPFINQPTIEHVKREHAS